MLSRVGQCTFVASVMSRKRVSTMGKYHIHTNTMINIQVLLFRFQLKFTGHLSFATTYRMDYGIVGMHMY